MQKLGVPKSIFEGFSLAKIFITHGILCYFCKSEKLCPNHTRQNSPIENELEDIIQNFKDK